MKSNYHKCTTRQSNFDRCDPTDTIRKLRFVIDEDYILREIKPEKKNFEMFSLLKFENNYQKTKSIS